jgi:hypothetical protein
MAHDGASYKGKLPLQAVAQLLMVTNLRRVNPALQRVLERARLWKS